MLTTIVVFFFCLLYTAAIAAQTKSRPADTESLADDPATAVARADTRALVQKLGFGKRVNVKLKNGAKVSGRITSFADDHFVVTRPHGAASAISYAEVTRITKQNEKLGIFHRPWVGIMFAAAGVGTLIVLTLTLFD